MVKLLKITRRGFLSAYCSLRTKWSETKRNVACVASVSVQLRSKERGTRVKDRAKNGVSKRAGRGWGRKEGKACRQTPRFSFLPHPLSALLLDCKTVGCFPKISKEIGKAWRKSLTRAKHASLTRPTGLSPVSLFSASFQTFCLTARAYLNKQKYRLFCSLLFYLRHFSRGL